jgi:hypothetical protein
MPISAVDCVQPALQHTRAQLFNPFRWGQWSRLALVGILAVELHVGGCSFGNFGGGWPHLPHKNQSEFLQSRASTDLLSLNPAQLPEQIFQHLGQFIGLILLGLLVFAVLGTIFLYISSVFRFILFDSVLRRQCAIGEGWQKWRRAGSRFFLWQVAFQITVWISALVLLGIPLGIAFAAGWTADLLQHIGRLIVGILLLGGLVLIFVLTTAVIRVLAKDFLVPIMALEDLDFADGWHRLLAMIRLEKGRYAIYLLLKLVLSIVAGIMFTIIAIIPALFVIVPSVIAVVAGRAAGMGLNVTTISLMIIFGSLLLFLLIYLIALVSVPATVFFPAYALHFLAARYPRLDAMLNPAPIPPVPQFPPITEPPPPFEAPPLPPTPEPIG